MTARVWTVRRQSGRTSTFESDVEIQRWILDGVLRPDEELSQRGGAWRTLGSIPEFSAFFAAAEAARPHPVRAIGVPPADAGPPEEELPSRPTESVPVPAPRRATSRLGLVAMLLAVAVAMTWAGMFEREAASSILEIPRAVLAKTARPRTAARLPADGRCPSAAVPRSACERVEPVRAPLATPPELAETPMEPKPDPLAVAAETTAPARANAPRSAAPAIRQGHGYHFYLSLGDAFRAEGRCPEAITAYRHALEVRRGAPEPLSKEGECLWESGDAAGAIERFEAALRRNPFHEPSRRGLERANGGGSEP